MAERGSLFESFCGHLLPKLIKFILWSVIAKVDKIRRASFPAPCPVRPSSSKMFSVLSLPGLAPIPVQTLSGSINRGATPLQTLIGLPGGGAVLIRTNLVSFARISTHPGTNAIGFGEPWCNAAANPDRALSPPATLVLGVYNHPARTSAPRWD